MLEMVSVLSNCRFGHNVKVVQFLGGYKPWNVKFHPPTGTLSPAANVHPTYVQFVQFWVQIFVKRVLPLFSSVCMSLYFHSWKLFTVITGAALPYCLCVV